MGKYMKQRTLESQLLFIISQKNLGGNSIKTCINSGNVFLDQQQDKQTHEKQQD